MAGEILTAEQVFSGEDIPQVPSGEAKKIVSADEVFGTGADKPTSVVASVSDEHRTKFVNTLGSDFYKEMLDYNQKFFEDSRKRLAGGVAGGIATINDFLGNILKRTFVGQIITAAAPGVGDALRKTFVEPGQQQFQQSITETPPDNGFQKTYFDTLTAVGSMAPTIPFDIMTGGATKVALAGRILPEMEAILGALPDFALGMGWRGMVKGIDESSNPIEAVIKGPMQGLEDMAFGTLYANAGVGLSGIGKMASMGLASSVYEAVKEGRPPTKDEMIEGMAQGAAMGFIFTALPHLRDATQVETEKAVLKGYEKKFNEVLDVKLATDAQGKPIEIKSKDPSELLTITDNLLHDEAIRPEIRRSLAQPFLDMLEQRGSLVAPELKVGDWKDAGTLSLLRETMERNLDGVAKADAKPVKEFTTERVKENETYCAKWLTTYRQLLEGKMKEWGIKPNSLDDKLIQRYGEGNATIAAVQVDSPKNWEKVVEASKWFRDQYDGLLGDINSVRARYGYEPIPKRPDYFRHFQELTAASQTFGLLLGGDNPPTSIAGIVRRPKPGKPFTPVEMKRLGGEYTESAIGGFDNYLRVASKQIFHTDSVQRMRMLDNYIRGQAESNDQIDLSNFMVNLRDYTDILAGQPADIDRTIQRNLGRPAYAVLRWLDKKTAANMIGANISAAVTNNITFTQSFATMDKVPALKGLFHSVVDSLNKDKHTFKIDGVESDLWTRRYSQQKINTNFWDVAGEKASSFFQAIDQFSVKAIISGKYFEGRSQGLDPQQAMKAAGDYTGKLVTDRSWGQLPVIMESKGLRVITRFQTEVNNMASFLIKDVPEMYHGDIKKLASAYTQFAVYSWVFNNLFEEVTGRRPTIDPIYMLATLAGINKSGRGRPFIERIEPAAKDIVGQIPFGNLLVEGGRFPVTAGIPNVWNLGEQPIKELSKPLFYLAPKFGGGQIKKTLEGMVSFAKGVSETPSGDERYGIHQDIRNFMQGFLFGGNAFPEAVKYWSRPKDDR